MNLDITFCAKRNCKNMKCDRNQKIYNWNEVFKIKPVVSVGIFEECEFFWR